jgi:hypothetical protein
MINNKDTKQLNPLQLKSFKRISKILGTSKTTLQKTTSDLLSTQANKKVVITLTPNNVFCTLVNLQAAQTEAFMSTGHLSLKVTKKTIKFSLPEIIFKFHALIDAQIKDDTILMLEIKGAKLLQDLVKTLVITKLKDHKLIIVHKHLLSFNGCRAKKQRRKKRNGLIPVKFV